MFEKVRGDLVTALFLGTLTFRSAKTLGVITLAGISTLFTPAGVFFLKEKALEERDEIVLTNSPKSSEAPPTRYKPQTLSCVNNCY